MSMYLDFNDPRLKQKLAELPEKMADWALEVVLDQAHLMVGIAQVLVDIDTGSLRDSTRVERGGTGKHWREVRVRAGGYITNPRTGRLVDYARYVEARHPFMLPAWLEVKDQITELLRTHIVEKANSE